MAIRWNNADLSNRVRNIVRRGYLLKTYNDGKLLKGRVKTGVGIENDKVDIVHPVGYISHIAPSEKTEVITMDVNGDPSKRVVLAVIGDREKHPKVEEGEAVFYQPGKPERFMRANDKGIQLDATDQPIDFKTAKTFNMNAQEGMVTAVGTNYTHNGDMIINGNLEVNGNIVCKGTVYARDFERI